VAGRAPKKRDNGRLQIGGFEMLMFWRGLLGRLVAGGARGLAPTLVLATNIGKERDLELLASFVNHNLNQTHRSITVACRHSALTSSVMPSPTSHRLLCQKFRRNQQYNSSILISSFHDSLGLNGLSHAVRPPYSLPMHTLLFESISPTGFRRFEPHSMAS
jgi:hypothetical protein